jgi:hypothetical protein
MTRGNSSTRRRRKNMTTKDDPVRRTNPRAVVVLTVVISSSGAGVMTEQHPRVVPERWNHKTKRRSSWAETTLTHWRSCGSPPCPLRKGQSRESPSRRYLVNQSNER